MKNKLFHIFMCFLLWGDVCAQDIKIDSNKSRNNTIELKNFGESAKENKDHEARFQLLDSNNVKNIDKNQGAKSFGVNNTIEGKKIEVQSTQIHLENNQSIKVPAQFSDTR